MDASQLQEKRCRLIRFSDFNANLPFEGKEKKKEKTETRYDIDKLFTE
jgi:hypothetical protein